MALATQCPHCKTIFRVAQDQLKLRTGLVRCGSCKEIFNGVEHLLAPEASSAQQTQASKVVAPVEKVSAHPAASPAPIPVPESVEDISSAGIPISILISAPAPAPTPASSALDFAYPEPIPEPEAEPVSERDPASVSEPDPPAEVHASEAVEFVEFVEVPRQPKEPTFEAHDAGDADAHPEDPLQRMTLVDFSDTMPPAEPSASELESPTEPTLNPDEPDPLDQVIDELKRKPLRGKKKPKPYARRPTQEIDPETAVPEIPEPEEPEEPDFVKQRRHKETVGRTIRIAMGIASFFLLLAGLAQATYTFRDQLAARVPETKPILISACTLLDCKIGLPAQIEAISIESDQLETLNTNKDASELSMLLRNVGTTTQAWPHIELTLNDANNAMLSRRVFAPHEYLPAPQDEKKGLATNSEQAIKLDFTFSGAKPAGYHVGVFYP